MLSSHIWIWTDKDEWQLVHYQSSLQGIPLNIYAKLDTWLA